MTRDELIAHFDDSVAKMREILIAKNADYTGGSADVFANFTRVEALDIAPTSVGFLTRMTDKLMRINALTKNPPAVVSESIQDTLLDLANYSLLFAAYLKSRKVADP